MKRIYQFFFSLILLFTFNKVQSQAEEFRLAQDILFLAEEFATPAAQGAAYQAGAGWFTSSQTLDPWRFEVSVHANALVVPSSKKESSVSNNALDILQIRGANAARVPTAFGGQTDVVYEGYKNEEISAIAGVDKGFVPHPFVQVTMGLPYESEITVRALPELIIDDVGFTNFGAGIKHNFSQYLRFNKPENLQISGIITYSRFDVNYAFDPIAIEDFAVLDLIEVDANLWMFEALASKRYSDFEIFGALGATNSNFGYQMDGSGQFLGNINTALETLGDSELQFKGDIGFNLYFNKFKVSSMVTAGRFFNINLGLHFRL